jgi:hypothetical protein
MKKIKKIEIFDPLEIIPEILAAEPFIPKGTKFVKTWRHGKHINIYYEVEED